MKIVKMGFLVLLLCVCAGCVSDSKIDPRVVSLNGKVLLTLEKYDFAGGGSLDEFSISVTKSKVSQAENIFLNKGDYKGYVAALLPQIPGNKGVGIVFRDGAVFGVKDDNFKSLELIVETTGEIEVIAAALYNDKIFAFGKGNDNTLAFYTLDNKSWVKSDISIPMLGVADVAIAEMVILDDIPVVFWREVVGRRVEPRMRMARLAGSDWEYLPELPAAPELAGGFAVCTSEESILLLQDSGAENSAASGGMPLYEYSLNDGWRSLPDVPFSKDSLTKRGYGIDIKYIAKKHVVARADETGVQVYYSSDVENGVWKGINNFEEEEVGFFDKINSEEIFNYVLIVTSFLLLIVFFRRKKKLKKALAQSENGEGPLVGDKRIEKLVRDAKIQRIGGFSSVLDRGFALLIDGFLVMPIPYYYLNAQSIDFMDSVFTVKEFVLFFIWLGSLTLYCTIAEMMFGRTVGKVIARIRVRKLVGGRPSSYQILIRNFARVIDFFPIPLGQLRIWYLIATIAASVTPKRQRIGDILAKTVVRRYTPLSKRKIVLASASPRRKELLTEFGLEFEIQPPDINETIQEGVLPRDMAKILATQKGDAIARGMQNGELVIAADTVVALGDKILGKPENPAEAREMLVSLSGTTHEVLTGVSIIDTATRQLIVAVERTEVEFRELSDAEINNYVESGEGEDKAGSYAIQGVGGLFVNETLGSTSNVIGMPMELFKKMLKDLDAS